MQKDFVHLDTQLELLLHLQLNDLDDLHQCDPSFFQDFGTPCDLVEICEFVELNLFEDQLWLQGDHRRN